MEPEPEHGNFTDCHVWPHLGQSTDRKAEGDRRRCGPVWVVRAAGSLIITQWESSERGRARIHGPRGKMTGGEDGGRERAILRKVMASGLAIVLASATQDRRRGSGSTTSVTGQRDDRRWAWRLMRANPISSLQRRPAASFHRSRRPGRVRAGGSFLSFLFSFSVLTDGNALLKGEGQNIATEGPTPRVSSSRRRENLISIKKKSKCLLFSGWMGAGGGVSVRLAPKGLRATRG